MLASIICTNICLGHIIETSREKQPNASSTLEVNSRYKQKDYIGLICHGILGPYLTMKGQSIVQLLLSVKKRQYE